MTLEEILTGVSPGGRGKSFSYFGHWNWILLTWGDVATYFGLPVEALRPSPEGWWF